MAPMDTGSDTPFRMHDPSHSRSVEQTRAQTLQDDRIARHRQQDEEPKHRIEPELADAQAEKDTSLHQDLDPALDDGAIHLERRRPVHEQSARHER